MSISRSLTAASVDQIFTCSEADGSVARLFLVMASVLMVGQGATDYPCCVGHEIAGTVVKAGSKVENGIK